MFPTDGLFEMYTVVCFIEKVVHQRLIKILKGLINLTSLLGFIYSWNMFLTDSLFQNVDSCLFYWAIMQQRLVKVLLGNFVE